MDRCVICLLLLTKTMCLVVRTTFTNHCRIHAVSYNPSSSHTSTELNHIINIKGFDKQLTALIRMLPALIRDDYCVFHSGSSQSTLLSAVLITCGLDALTRRNLFGLSYKYAGTHSRAKE
jgi:hypothetical protein